MFKQKPIFSRKECQKIINETEKVEDFYWNKFDRIYASSQIYKNENNEWIFKNLIDFFEESSGIKTLKHTIKRIHFHKFIEGDFFTRHNDSRDGRIYSLGVNLNDDYLGGDFILYDEISNTNVIEKKEGNSYFFDAATDHEILQVKNGIRFSLILFLKMENLSMKREKTI